MNDVGSHDKVKDDRERDDGSWTRIQQVLQIWHLISTVFCSGKVYNENVVELFVAFLGCSIRVPNRMSSSNSPPIRIVILQSWSNEAVVYALGLQTIVCSGH